MINDGRPLIPNQPTYCPVTGLPIISKPEWTDVRLDSDFHVTFRIIGNAILFSTPRGNASYTGIQCLFKKIAEILHEAGLSGKKYIELKDYSMLTNITPRAVRIAWSNYMLKEAAKGYLQGVWVFGTSLFLRLMFQTGQKINKPAIPFIVVKDYPEAIQSALTVLRQKGVDVGEGIQPGLTKNDWSLEIEGYGISFELIGDDILYTIAHGRLKEHDVDKFFKLHNKVLHESGLFEKGYFYRIMNWEKMERSSWQVRRMYIEGMKEVNKHITCKMTVIFGLNPFMKALAEVSRPFMPSPVIIAKDFQDAHAVIENAKERKRKAGSTGKIQKHKEETFTETQVKGFADEMLQVLGELNWEQVGLSVDGIREEHPLKAVFDALAVIKLDLDELLREKEKSQKSLQESEEKYRNILESMNDSYFELDLKGNMSFCNQTLPKVLGYTQEEISGINYRSYMDPENAETIAALYRKAYTGDIPATVATYEVTKKDGTRMPVETSFSLIKGADGKPVGFRGIVRDITERTRAEERLRESEKRFISIFNAQQNGIIIIDPATHTIIDVNAAALKMIGATHEEAVGCICHSYICPAAKGRCPITDLQMDIDNAERVLVRKDLTTMPILKSVSRMTLGGKEFLIESFIDISDRKKAEDALKESEGKYRSILESIEDGYFEVDLAGSFTFFNPAMCSILGYPRDEMPGLNYRKYMDDIDAKRVFQTFNKIYITEIPSKGYEWDIIRKDGVRKHLEVSVSLIANPDGSPNGFRGIARDVSKRKVIELELKKHRDHLEEMVRERTTELMRTTNFLANIINSSIDGIITTDIEGTITHTSPRITDILGYEQHEVMGKKFHTLFAGGYEESEKILDEVMKRGGIGGYELRSTKKNGESVMLNLSISLLRDEKGDIIGTTSIYRDVTEEKRMEEAMKQAMQRAESASKAKSQFLANMSHEIRTPLNGILGMTDMCLETELDREQRHLVDIINREANSLLGIVNEILDFAKIEAGKIDLENIPFDLNNLLEDMAESSSYRTAQKGLTFISCLAPDVPTRLVGDPSRLRQVLRNLIDNAIKFTHEGEINVKADLTEDLGDRIKVRFRVNDTGIGIPKDKQAIIFKSFTQVDGSTTRKYGGTGLGITISKQLAELMGGTLGVESEEGKGSTFWFTIVFSRQSETDAPIRKEVSLSHVKVLVVDNNQISRRTIIEYARSWGSSPVEAASAKDALSILIGSTADGKHFNLVLSDLNMPEMNGFDLARSIRGREPIRSIPIIILTASGNPGDGKICREIGIEGYLTKPFTEKDLRNAAEIVVGTSIYGEGTGKGDLVTKHSLSEMDRRNIRILLAEDYPTNQEIAKKYLEHAGYQVDLAEDGKQALESFQRRRYDLILMDIQMPIMDGFQATAAIRKVETDIAALGNENINQMTHRVPIIAMTAHAMKEHQGLCLEAGMDDFLSKPISKKGLLSMLDKWIQSGAESSRSTKSDHHLPSNTVEKIYPPEAHTGKPMDLERALEEFEGDKEVLSEVIEGFTRKVGEQIGTIRRALSCGDAETIRKEAHSIKGGAANLTAEKLSKTAFELESKGKNKEIADSGEIVDVLERELGALTRYVQDNFSKHCEP